MEQLGLPVDDICDKIRDIIQDSEKKSFDHISSNYHHRTLYSLKTIDQSPVMSLNVFFHLGTGYREYSLVFERDFYDKNKLNPIFHKFYCIFPTMENKFIRRIEFSLITSKSDGYEFEEFERPLGLKFVNCVLASKTKKDNIYENCEFINV